MMTGCGGDVSKSEVLQLRVWATDDYVIFLFSFIFYRDVNTSEITQIRMRVQWQASKMAGGLGRGEEGK